MEPFEWLLLGVGLAVGSLLGSQGKGLMRTAAKGYYTLEEKTKMWTANMREDFHDAVEEARYERDEEMAHQAVGSGAEREEPARASNGRKRGGGTRGGGAAGATRSRAARGTGTRKRGGTTGRRGRNTSAQAGGETGTAENTETT